MFPSFISISVSATSESSPLLRRSDAAARDTLGGEGDWEHVNCCLYHARNRYCALDHVLRALEGVCKDAGYSTSLETVLTSEDNRRADLEVFNIRVAQQTDLLVDVTLRHNFIGAGRDGGINHRKLRKPDHPDQILEGAAAEKIRNYRSPYRRNRQVAFLPACMTTSGRIHGELLRLLFFLANKRADDFFQALGYHRTSKSSATGAASSSSNTGAHLGWHVLRLSRYEAPTTARRHVASPRHLPPLNMAYDEYDNNERHVNGVA